MIYSFQIDFIFNICVILQVPTRQPFTNYKAAGHKMKITFKICTSHPWKQRNWTSCNVGVKHNHVCVHACVCASKCPSYITFTVAEDRWVRREHGGLSFSLCSTSDSSQQSSFLCRRTAAAETLAHRAPSWSCASVLWGKESKQEAVLTVDKNVTASAITKCHQ